MKKTGTTIAGIILSAVFAFSGPAVPAGIVFETALPPVAPLTSILSAVVASPDPISISETLLPASNLLPLMSMDLYPAPVAPPAIRDYSRMNLDPKAAVLAVPAFRRAAPLSGFGDAIYDVSLLSYLALNVADYVSTRECLKYPGLSEGNPMMKPFVKNPYAFAAVKAGLSAVSYLSMKKMYQRSKPLAWAVSLVSNMALSYVVSNNYRLLQQAKARCS